MEFFNVDLGTAASNTGDRAWVVNNTCGLQHGPSTDVHFHRIRSKRAPDSSKSLSGGKIFFSAPFLTHRTVSPARLQSDATHHFPVRPKFSTVLMIDESTIHCISALMRADPERVFKDDPETTPQSALVARDRTRRNRPSPLDTNQPVSGTA